MIINNIDTKDISVVVQGAISKENTTACLLSIRQFLPYSTIILSTWEGNDVNGLEYDKVIFNKDPGISGYRTPCNVDCQKVGDNTNRQIFSTKNGLKEVKTKYALKIRSDFVIEGTDFLENFDIYNDYFPEENLKLFNKKLLVLGLIPLIRKNNLLDKILFFIGDFVTFGETEDVLKLWDIPLMDNNTIDYYYKNGFVNTKGDAFKFVKQANRYFAEVYIFVNCIAKNLPNIFNSFKDYTDTSLENIELSKKMVVNNFVVLDSKMIGIAPGVGKLGSLRNEIYFPEWLSLYNHYFHNTKFKAIKRKKIRIIKKRIKNNVTKYCFLGIPIIKKKQIDDYITTYVFGLLIGNKRISN